MNKLRITCTCWRPLRKGTLYGFCRVRINELKLIIFDIAVHKRGDSRWAQLPGPPWVRNGALVTENGKTQYAALLEFETREFRDAFSRAVVTVLLQFAPDAFEEESVA